MQIVIVSVLLVIAQCYTCHYSCSTCTGPSYVSCLSCPTGSFVETVEDTSKMPSEYWSSVYPSGTCVDTFAPSANAMGIIIFIVLISVCLFFRTKQSFYLLLTFQTYGLYNLVEIAWVNPIGYVLQGLQYLMIFNTLGYGYKSQNYILIASKNYRLSKYLQTTSIAQNIAIIAGFSIICLIVLIVISIITVRKNPKKKKEDVIFESIQNKSEQSKRGRLDEAEKIAEEEEQKKQCCYCWKTFSEQVLIKIAKFLLCFMFLMVQQTCLVLLVTLVYVTPVSAGIIALCVIYIHILVFIMSYSYYYRIEYFKDKKIMYLTYAQKIIMPVMVVVPIEYQYVFFIFAASFLIIEFVFDNINGLYKQLNRLAFYKVTQIITVILLIIYYLVEKNAKSYSSSKAAGITCTFILTLNLFMFVAVELPMSIKEKYFPSKASNEGGKELSEKQAQIIMHDDTLENLDHDPNHNKVEVMIIEKHSSSDGEEEEEDDKNHHLNDKNSNNLDEHDRNEDHDLTKDGNNSSVAGGKDEHSSSIVHKEEDNKEEPKEEKKEPPKKKKRKQIIDPQLRMRYGI